MKYSQNHEASKMDKNLPESFLNIISIFPFILKLFSKNSPKISNFISLFFYTALAKLRLKSMQIKSISIEYFEHLIFQNKYESEFDGDVYACALISINTLAALSLRNRSWLKIKKCASVEPHSDSTKAEEKFNWKIKMPPVQVNHSNSTKENDYCIQCVCVSNLPKDFVMYVTNVKHYNISKHLNCSNSHYDLVSIVETENAGVNINPKIAQNAVVAGITSSYDVAAKDYEDILSEYFVKPKHLKVDEVFRVDLLKLGGYLKSTISLCRVREVYFKVVSISGETDEEGHYVVKGYTSVYLNPPIHGYIPPKEVQYIEKQQYPDGHEISTCPEGLLKYSTKLKKMFKPFLAMDNIEVKPMFLMCGIKGSGKKIVLQSVADSFGLHLLSVNCFDFYGQNASLVQGKFDQLFAKARRTVPCVVHLEDIEFLGRDQNDHENARLIDIFESHVNELWMRKPNSYPLVLVGSTNSTPEEVVPAIARLFVQTITFEAPKFEETLQNLNWLCKNSNVTCGQNDLIKIAEKVRGFVWADLVLLTEYAIRFQSQDGECHDKMLSQKHFQRGIEIMEAAYSESIGAARVPTVKWDDVGGLDKLKEEIMLTLNLPLKHPELFASGLKRSGIMFYGPPGTGKTLMAKAVATECNYNFLSVKGPELMNMYVGQSEKNVRDVFDRARNASPCIIFFDELDSLAPSRGKSGDSGGVTDRVVSQLCAEMDGLDQNKDVFVIAATNRPDLVDPALLRPGRFDKMFYVGVCDDEKSKLNVFEALTKRFVLSAEVNFEKLTKELPDLVTGADVYSICSNAWFSAARRAVSNIEAGLNVVLPLEVTSEDFSEAIREFVPSLSAEDIDYYNNLRS